MHMCSDLALSAVLGGLEMAPSWLRDHSWLVGLRMKKLAHY